MSLIIGISLGTSFLTHGLYYFKVDRTLSLWSPLLLRGDSPTVPSVFGCTGLCQPLVFMALLPQGLCTCSHLLVFPPHLTSKVPSTWGYTAPTLFISLCVCKGPVPNLHSSTAKGCNVVRVPVGSWVPESFVTQRSHTGGNQEKEGGWYPQSIQVISTLSQKATTPCAQTAWTQVPQSHPRFLSASLWDHLLAYISSVSHTVSGTSETQLPADCHLERQLGGKPAIA
jgi:hypothetical protein